MFYILKRKYIIKFILYKNYWKFYNKIYILFTVSNALMKIKPILICKYLKHFCENFIATEISVLVCIYFNEYFETTIITFFYLTSYSYVPFQKGD